MINNLTSENKEMTSNIGFINASPKPEELSVNDLDYNVVYYINTEINQKYYILVTDGNNDYLVNLMDTNFVMLPVDSVNGVKFYKCKSVTISIDR